MAYGQDPYQNGYGNDSASFQGLTPQQMENVRMQRQMQPSPTELMDQTQLMPQPQLLSQMQPQQPQPPMPRPPMPRPPMPQPSMTSMAQKRTSEPKNKKPLIITLAIVLALMVIGCGVTAYFVFFAGRCKADGCNEKVAKNSKYCDDHTCAQRGCYELAEDGKYCEEHQIARDKAEKEHDEKVEAAFGERLSYGWNSEYWNLRFELPDGMSFSTPTYDDAIFQVNTKASHSGGKSSAETLFLMVDELDKGEDVADYLDENFGFVGADTTTPFCGSNWRQFGSDYADGIWLTKEEDGMVCAIYYEADVTASAYSVSTPLLSGCFSTYDAKPSTALATTKATTAPTTKATEASKRTGYAKEALVLRKSASRNSESLGRVPKNSSFAVLSDPIYSNGETYDKSDSSSLAGKPLYYYKVKYNGKTGYVCTEFVSFTKP